MKIKNISQAYSEAVDYIIKRKTGELKPIKTPWSKFNSIYMNGIEWNWIITLAGMSGSGKTAFLNLLETAFAELNKDQHIHVLNFNFEMQAYRLMTRKISKRLNKSVKQLYSSDILEGNNIKESEVDFIKNSYFEEIKDDNISYVEETGTVDQIIATIDQYAKSIELEKNEKGLIVTLDHSLLVKSKRDEDERGMLINLMAAFNELKKKYLKITFIVISQLNRNIESEARRINALLHYPTKQDIFGSDALYQFSDAVIVLHRPEMLGIPYYGTERYETTNKIFCHHLKVRDGEPCITQFKNNLRVNDFIEL